MPNYIQIRPSLKHHLSKDNGKSLCGIKRKSVMQEVIKGCENPDKVCKRCEKIKKKNNPQVAEIEKKCVWTYYPKLGYHGTLCGKSFEQYSIDLDFIYCPYCGNKIDENIEQPF